MDQTFTTVLMFGALILGGYFLLIRPQQKRAKDQQAMIAQLTEGSRVMLTSGLFATIRHLGTKQAIVEVSPGVELTIVRQAIVRAVPADEEEFEYSDDVDSLDEFDDLEDAGDGGLSDDVRDESTAFRPDGDEPEPVADEAPESPDQGADKR